MLHHFSPKGRRAEVKSAHINIASLLPSPLPFYPELVGVVAIMSYFARSLLPTARALCSRSALNPVHHTPLYNAARCYATAFERTKPHVNIGTIGHVDHGKVPYIPTPPALLPNPNDSLMNTGLIPPRPPSQPPSPNAKQKRGLPPSSNMGPSTKPQRSVNAVLPSRPRTLNTKLRPATTPTSTAQATPTTSKT